MPSMVPFQASWLEFYRVMHVIISSRSVHMYGFDYFYVVPQIFNYVLMNIIINWPDSL